MDEWLSVEDRNNDKQLLPIADAGTPNCEVPVACLPSFPVYVMVIGCFLKGANVE